MNRFGQFNLHSVLCDWKVICFWPRAQQLICRLHTAGKWWRQVKSSTVPLRFINTVIVTRGVRNSRCHWRYWRNHWAKPSEWKGSRKPIPFHTDTQCRPKSRGSGGAPRVHGKCTLKCITQSLHTDEAPSCLLCSLRYLQSHSFCTWFPSSLCVASPQNSNNRKTEMPCIYKCI